MFLFQEEKKKFDHTMHVCDAAAKIAVENGLSREERIILMFAALLHDIGKPLVTKVSEDTGRIIAPNHASVGVELAKQFLESICAPNWVIENVLPLVAEHMAHIGIPEPTKKTVKRLSLRVQPSNIKMLSYLMMADHAGRPPLDPTPPDSITKMVEIANELQIESEAIKPLLMGRHLIDLGFKPSKVFTQILSDAFNYQIDNGITDINEMKEWVKTSFKNV